MPLNVQWGHLTLIHQWTEPRKATRNGREYIADSTGGPVMWRLRCACGHEFDLPRENFPGRRRMRSCLRPECPYDKPQITPIVIQKTPKRAAQPGISLTVYVPGSVLVKLEEYAAAKGIGRGKAVTELLTASLRQEGVMIITQ